MPVEIIEIKERNNEGMVLKVNGNFEMRDLVTSRHVQMSIAWPFLPSSWWWFLSSLQWSSSSGLLVGSIGSLSARSRWLE